MLHLAFIHERLLDVWYRPSNFFQNTDKHANCLKMRKKNHYLDLFTCHKTRLHLIILMESMQTVLPEQPVETPIRQLTEPVWSESSVFTEKKFRHQYLIGPQLFQIQVFWGKIRVNWRADCGIQVFWVIMVLDQCCSEIRLMSLVNF